MANFKEDLIFKLLPPPATLPIYNEKDLRSVSYFGTSNFVSGLYRSQNTFGIKRADRRRHIYMIGKSGMGKTRLLEQLLRFDIAGGHGVALIDPHGDLAKSLLAFIPQQRITDVVYVDPNDSGNGHPIAFNPFSRVEGPFRQTVAQGLVEIFKKQFASSWTPRMEHLFRFATLAMLEHPEGTLYELTQLLSDARARQRSISYITDEVVKRFFAVEFAAFSQKYDSEAITPLLNRLGQFFADPLLRAIFSQKENKIDFDDIMNNRRILIVNTSKGNIGEENSALLGAFFLTKLTQTTMARSRFEEAERKEFYLYVDEFQNVATQSFSSLFSESRKYALNITIANQYLAQIPMDLQEAIFGNVSTLISFRIGGADAVRIAKEFQPLVQEQDLINLGVRDFYIKMSIDGETSHPFSARTADVSSMKNEERIQEVIDASRRKYAGVLQEPSASMAPVIDKAPDIQTMPFMAASELPQEDELPPPV